MVSLTCAFVHVGSVDVWKTTHIAVCSSCFNICMQDMSLSVCIPGTYWLSAAEAHIDTFGGCEIKYNQAVEGN